MNKHFPCFSPEPRGSGGPVRRGGTSPRAPLAAGRKLAPSFCLKLRVWDFNPNNIIPHFFCQSYRGKCWSCQECLAACFVSHTRVEKKTKIIPSLLWNKVSDGRGKAASLYFQRDTSSRDIGCIMAEGGNLQQGPQRVPFWNRTDWADKEPPVSAGSQNMLPDTSLTHAGVAGCGV